MENAELISVIIPVYNVEEYLRKCLDSVLNQTYKNLQIIVVDDGSPDNCPQICDEYAQKDSRIEVIHQKNAGLSAARNAGIDRANGKYIGFVDSDDYIANDMFEKMYDLIKQNNVDACITNFYVVNGENISIRNSAIGDRIVDSFEVLKEILLDKNIQSYAWNKLYKKELFDEIRYPVGKKYEDIGTTFYVLEKCKKVVVSSKPYYYYVNRANSIVNVVKESTVLDYMNLILTRYYYIKEKYPQMKLINEFYLLKTLITAYNDKLLIKDATDILENELENFYNECRNFFETDESEIVKFFSNEDKIRIYTLINDRTMYYDICNCLNRKK